MDNDISFNSKFYYTDKSKMNELCKLYGSYSLDVMQSRSSQHVILVMHGRDLSIYMGMVSCVSVICYLEAICIEKSHWKLEFCPLSGIRKRPLLGGWFSITTMLISWSLFIVERLSDSRRVCCK